MVEGTLIDRQGKIYIFDAVSDVDSPTALTIDLSHLKVERGFGFVTAYNMTTNATLDTDSTEWANGKVKISSGVTTNDVIRVLVWALDRG